MENGVDECCHAPAVNILTKVKENKNIYRFFHKMLSLSIMDGQTDRDQVENNPNLTFRQSKQLVHSDRDVLQAGNVFSSLVATSQVHQSGSVEGFQTFQL